MLLLKALELNTALQIELHENGLEGHLPLPDVTLLKLPRMHSTLQAASARCPVTLVSHQMMPPGLHSMPVQVVIVLGIALTRRRTFYLTVLILMKFTWSHLSSLSKSLWMLSHPSSVSSPTCIVVSSANLLRTHSIYTSPTVPVPKLTSDGHQSPL